MTIAERYVGDVCVLDISGPITLGAEGTGRLGDKVRSVLQQGRKSVLVNLRGVSYVDSAGLGEIVQAYATVTRQGGTLKLTGLNNKLTDLLVVTKLLTVFESYDSEDEAIASFSARP